MDVYRFAYWLAGEAAEAEDITAETFARAWGNFGKIRTETLKAYLFTIARHLYLERQRKQTRLTHLEDVYADPQLSPERISENNAELKIVRQLLQALPEVDRAAFILRVQHELPYAEIARTLQLSESAVKVKVHRVRAKLLATRMGWEASG